jgi:quercetin dioxygenase-like cupin family protein
MRYTRLFADAAGESHFEEAEVASSEVTFAPPAPPMNLTSPVPAIQCLFWSASPGWFGDWHPAPRRQFFFQISGELEVQVSDGELRHFGPGSVILAEDVKGEGHTTRVVGQSEMLGAIVQLPG